jgi:hypothetical protein
MQTITFNQHWNGSYEHSKYNNNYFTTLRLHNPNKYKLNEVYNINDRHKTIKQACIIKLVQKTAVALSDMFFYLDTGYSKEKSLQIIKTMYRFSNEEMQTKIFDVILLETIKTTNNKQQTNHL